MRALVLVALVVTAGCVVEPVHHARSQAREQTKPQRAPWIVRPVAALTPQERDAAERTRADRLRLDAENAVRYCKEVWDAWLYVGGETETASRRVAKALRDLDRVKSGDFDVVLERDGGFPSVNWVSGYYRTDGVYVPGRPPSVTPIKALAMDVTSQAVEAALRR